MVDKIYFDMDGVLADFERGIKELCGVDSRPQDPSLGEGYDDDMWERVKNVDHFYDKLALMPGAKDMFDAVYSKYGDKCEILSAIPKPKRGILNAGEDKEIWVRRMLSENVKVNIVVREEKQNYCTSKGCILIDDLKDNIKDWEEYGGTGILHSDAKETMAKLKAINVL